VGQLIFSIMLLVSWPNLEVSLAAGTMEQPAFVAPISEASSARVLLRGLLSPQASGNRRDGLGLSARERH
jgi:hypothetical protein